MTKQELVQLTLKQLEQSLKTTPENFRFEDPTSGQTNGAFPGPTVIWQFKVELEENKYIQDPLNSTKTVIVTYNRIAKQLTCYIFNREVNSLSYSQPADTQVTISYHEWLHPHFYSTYRKFMDLKNDLVKRKNEKEYMDYMKKLNQIFPSTHEDELLK